MSTLRIDNLYKLYGEVPAVNRVSFDVEPGEFLSLLGPSGCGKTTTLRCIAGFERPDRGRIYFGDEPLTDIRRGVFVPPNRRGFGMVFQSYAVWPHMTVLDNVGYPLTVRSGISRSEIRERVNASLELVGLAGYEKRYPTQLSGGQQQRVALARALVMEPRVLLFDEPLSNLDAKLRERMRFELIELQSQLGIPAVYVTHDQAEAMVISRRILVMEQGKIAQMGRPREIYERPATRFVADFIGLTNFVPATVEGCADGGHWAVNCGLGDQLGVSERQHAPGDSVVLAIRPERVELSLEKPAGGNVFAAKLHSAYYVGPYTEYFLDVDGLVLRAQRSAPLDVRTGDRLFGRVAPEDCLLVIDTPRGNTDMQGAKEEND
ncbi:MAG TPA: ABC transporter ATP-binding protein [Kiloniellales bacterium]|nr:ABC transporter ATP-binding protein [Kiloniellales bacterium]